MTIARLADLQTRRSGGIPWMIIIKTGAPDECTSSFLGIPMSCGKAMVGGRDTNKVSIPLPSFPESSLCSLHICGKLKVCPPVHTLTGDQV